MMPTQTTTMPMKDVVVSTSPGTPDSLPVLGRDGRYTNLLHAFGHGHTGLMGASVSGHVIADLVAGRRPELDLAPYRPERF